MTHPNNKLMYTNQQTIGLLQNTKLVDLNNLLTDFWYENKHQNNLHLLESKTQTN